MNILNQRDETKDDKAIPNEFKETINTKGPSKIGKLCSKIAYVVTCIILALPTKTRAEEVYDPGKEANCVDALVQAEKDMVETDASQYQKIRDAVWTQCAGIRLNMDKNMYLLEVDGELLLHQGQYDSASGQFQKVIQRYDDNFKQSCGDKNFLGKTCHDVYNLRGRAHAGVQDAEEIKKGSKTVAEGLQKQKEEQKSSKKCEYSWSDNDYEPNIQDIASRRRGGESMVRILHAIHDKKCGGILVFPEYIINLDIEEGEIDLREGGRKEKAKTAFKKAIQKYEDDFKQFCTSYNSPDCNPVNVAYKHALKRLQQLDAIEAEKQRRVAEEEQAEEKRNEKYANFCKSLPALTTPRNISKAHKMLHEMLPNYSNTQIVPTCAGNIHDAVRRTCVQYIDINGYPYHQGVFTRETPYSIRRAGDDTYYIEPPQTLEWFDDHATAVIDVRSKLPMPASVTVEYTTIAVCTLLNKKRTSTTTFALSSHGSDKRFIDVSTFGILANCRLDMVKTEIEDCDF